jgi:hypothetical protein
MVKGSRGGDDEKFNGNRNVSVRPGVNVQRMEGGQPEGVIGPPDLCRCNQKRRVFDAEHASFRPLGL